MRSALLFATTILLALPGASAASSISLEVTSGEPVETDAFATIHLDRGAQGLWSGPGGGGGSFRMASGVLEIHAWRKAQGVVVAQSLERPPPVRIDLAGVAFALDRDVEDDGGFVLVADAPVTVEGRLRGSGLPQVFSADAGASGLPVDPDIDGPLTEPRLEHEWREGDVAIGSYADAQYQVHGFPAPDAPRLRVSGAFQLEMNGGTIRIGNDSYALGNWSDPAAPEGPESSGIRRYSRAIVVGEGEAEIQLPRMWALGAPSATALLDGRTEWRDATGSVEIDGARHAFERADLAVDGAIRLVARAAPVTTAASPSTYAAEGEVESLRVDGRVVLAEGPPTIPTGRAATTVVGLAALVAVAAKLASVLYTRLRSDELLDHPTRRAIYETVMAQPGLHFRALHRVAGCAYGPFLFHTRLLAEAGYLRFARQGRYLQAYATANDAASPTAIPNPVARAVYAALPAGDLAGPTEIASRAGVSRQLASYHLRRLEKVGLVRREGAAFTRAALRQTVGPID